MDWIGAYIEEDLPGGDVTSEAIFPASATGQARMVAREHLLAAGLQRAADVFARFGVAVHDARPEGDWVDGGTTLLRVEGPVRGILAAERLALNMVGRMSGIAGQTRRLMETLATNCSAARIAGSRKTTPGFRIFEKEAIVIGGGEPHRMSLSDEAMVKDNHREAAGSVTAAIQAVKAAHPELLLTTEVESLEDALAAAAAGTDWIMLDNQPPDVGRAWAEAVWQAHPDVKIEASGGIRPEHVAAYGWADRISMGWLTHHATSMDVGLDWGPA